MDWKFPNTRGTFEFFKWDHQSGEWKTNLVEDHELEDKPYWQLILEDFAINCRMVWESLMCDIRGHIPEIRRATGEGNWVITECTRCGVVMEVYEEVDL